MNTFEEVPGHVSARGTGVTARIAAPDGVLRARPLCGRIASAGVGFGRLRQDWLPAFGVLTRPTRTPTSVSMGGSAAQSLKKKPPTHEGPTAKATEEEDRRQEVFMWASVSSAAPQ